MIQGQSYCFLDIVTIYFFFWFCLFLNTFASSPTRPLCRPDQRDALLELQKEFPIHNVTVSSWNNSVDCCSWNDVSCDTILGVVISLFIRSSTTVNTNLKSNSALFKLQHLTHLDLSFCSLHGAIPSSIGNLSHLQSLDFSHNYLVGEIPASFANLTKLSDLYLEGNQFTGGLDLVLPNFTSLSILDISTNHFQSSIFPYLSRLHNLKLFYGSDNSFVGSFPSSLLINSSLVILHLRHNNFGGQIPRSIWVVHNLKYLDLSHNNFRGQIPKSIYKLIKLSTLYLSYNKLEGQVPQCLWRSSKLYYVDLSHNSFNSFGRSMEVISGASFISELDLASNAFQGPFPQWICKLRYLLSLDLSNNRLTGSIPECLSRLDQFLNLRNNSLSGFIPDLCINGLVSIDLSHNNLVGKLPESLINCTHMEILNVKGNKIKDTFPFWLGFLQDLKVLVLGTNAFYGPVYNSFAYLGFPSLRIIDISNNNFVGLLPQDYFANWFEMSSVWRGNEDIPEMNYMRFDYHQYTLIDLVYKGVDTDFARIFHAFKAIDFSGNQFCGEIPESIGVLKDLHLLNLSGNTFTGNIPPSLANISKLEILDLSQNNLLGEIPQELGKLTFLSNINFSYNHLEGLVPQSTQFGSQDCSSFMGNPELHGLEEICGEIHHVPIPTSQQPEESSTEPKEKVSWIAAAIAFGPGVFCGIVIGHIFTSYKHEWLRAKLC